jgi:syntaxin-binding protein 1
MAHSILGIQRLRFLDAVRHAAPGEWKILIVDDDSRRLMDNVVREDDILEERVMNIEQIEAKRQPNPDVDAVYILTPLAHIVDCLMADLAKRRYRRLFILWTSILPPTLRERLERSREAQEQIAVLRVLNLDFHPREARLVTLRDPFSFPILYHPSCSSLVQKHISDLAQRVCCRFSRE